MTVSPGVSVHSAACKAGNACHALKPLEPKFNTPVYDVLQNCARFDGQRAPYSNYGTGLTLVAPGGDNSVDQNGDGYPDGILAQTFDPRKGYDSFAYYFYAGTSMAAPQVSGVAALALSVNPHLGASGLRQDLIASATHLGRRGWDPSFGPVP